MQFQTQNRLLASGAVKRCPLCSPDRGSGPPYGVPNHAVGTFSAVRLSADFARSSLVIASAQTVWTLPIFGRNAIMPEPAEA